MEVFFESDDCTGQAFLFAEQEESLARTGILWNGLVRYPADPIATRTVSSTKTRFEDGSETECFGNGGFLLTNLGAEQTVDPAGFGVAAPFHLQD
jgi:hypothetical protein